jgi:hypothetical protein
MPELISITIPSHYLSGYQTLCGYGRRDTAVSDELKRARIEAARYFEQSQALFGAKAAAISSIQEIVGECSAENWDGYGAEPVSLLAAWNAEGFIRALPDGFPIPEAAPEPDGSISLDWTMTNNRRVALSIGQNKRLAFAWVNGTERGQAVVNFDGVNLPNWFIPVIGPIVNYAKPAFRTS